MSLARVRSQFPVLEEIAYLNAGTFGPVPRACEAAVTAGNRSELAHGRSGPAYFPGLRDARAELRATLATLIGAQPDELALTRSTTDGCNIVVAGLGLEPGDEIVTTDIEHFGLLGAIGASPATVRVAPVLGCRGEEIVERVSAEIGPRTRLIALSHVSWITGDLLPIGDVAQLGPPVLLDAAQSVGAIPVDVAALDCPFVTFPGQKWLLGPDGTGGLYVRADWIERVATLCPSYYGQDGYEPDGTMTPAGGATRFDPGTIPAPAVAGLLAALRFADGLGEERFARARELTARAVELLQAVVDVQRGDGGGTLVSFEPHEPAAEASARLAGEGIIVRDLPPVGWLRASIGFWNDERDVERLVEAVSARAG